MEQIKELTKRLISNSFKELLLQNPFEKITIKMITDHANVIRPTFYNHFHDKYELLEWILRDEIVDRAIELAQDMKPKEGIRLIFNQFYEDREFYRKAMDITGQNGFIETLSVLLSEFFQVIAARIQKRPADVPVEVMGRFYSSGMITMIRMELESDEKPNDIIRIYGYLMGHTVYDISK